MNTHGEVEPHGCAEEATGTNITALSRLPFNYQIRVDFSTMQASP